MNGSARLWLLAGAVASCAVSPWCQAGLLTGSTGGGQPLTNVQPTIAMTHLVRMQGVFQDLGEVILFAGDYVPQGWAPADGRLLLIPENEPLFAKLGTTYGGDGVTTFALPDLRGRTPIGNGQGPGLNQRTLGDKVGSLAVTLTEAQLPAHSHTLPGGAGPTGSTGSGQSLQNMQPSLAMNYLVALQGVFPTPSFASADAGPIVAPSGISPSVPILGSIHLHAGAMVPNGYSSADGLVTPINENDPLFALLGTTYGGNGVTTFNLPDLRGRAVLGATAGGGGLSAHPLAEQIGQERHTLTVAEMPSHNHTVPGAGGPTGPTGGNQPLSTMQPTLALQYLIAVQGIYPQPSFDLDSLDTAIEPASLTTDPYLAEIGIFAGSYVPQGWLPADGRLLSIQVNEPLFTILGTQYGGDGVSTFALPDLRGRVVVGTGAGPGTGDWSLGEKLGSEMVSLTVAELPPHRHTTNLPATLIGDANQDCSVGAGDYAIWAASFGQTGVGLPADFDGDGTVGAGDYVLWAANFGQTCPPDLSVPEPPTAALMLGMLALGLRRWRRALGL